MILKKKQITKNTKEMSIFAEYIFATDKAKSYYGKTFSLEHKHIHTHRYKANVIYYFNFASYPSAELNL